MSKLHVILAQDGARFLAYGGAPGGRDVVHNTVKRWPGWKRNRKPGTVPELVGSVGVGGACSIFMAPVSALTASHLDNYSHGVAWCPSARAAAEAAIQGLQRARAALDATKPKPIPGLPSDRTALTHQTQAIRAIGELGARILLADDMGLGKTSTAIWATYQHFGSSTPCTLVICPASVKFNWQREAWACLGRDTFVQVIDGTAPERASQIADLQHHQSKGGTGFAIINYDLIVKMAVEKKGELEPSPDLLKLERWVQAGALLLDECYYVKNRKSKRFRIIEEFFAPRNGGALFRILMSGTPVRNLVDDLFAQVELLRPGTWTSYTDFCKRHLDIAMKQLGQGPKAKRLFTPVGGKNLDALNLVMNTLQIRRKKEDVLDLPPKIRTFPELQLEGPHLKVYKAMREWAILELDKLSDDDVFTPDAGGAAQVAMRCEQLAQGFIGGVPEVVAEKIPWKLAHKIKGRPNEIVFPDSPKMAWLIEQIECLWMQGCRPVVFARFNAPLLYLRHKYEDDSFILHGGQTSKMKDGVVERYQAGERKLLLAQVKISEGWTCTSSQDELFHSRDWSPAVNAQGEDRLYRIGTKGTVNIQIPIVTNTVEKSIDRKLRNKAEQADGALRVMTVGELKEML